MILRFCWLVAAVLLSPIHASVKITSPEAGSTIQAGEEFSIRWAESGTTPSIVDMTSYKLFLCAGGDYVDNYITLKPLETNSDFAGQEAGSTSSIVEADLGEDFERAYFIKMVSTFPGGSVVDFSGRFSISGMTGKFPPDVTLGLLGGIKDAEPSIHELLKRQAVPVDDLPAEADTPYRDQKPPIRYAPAPIQPPKKMDDDANPKPLYPTSSVKIATAHLPPGSFTETLTAEPTFSVKSIENPAKPQPKPTDDMQKFLNRWRD